MVDVHKLANKNKAGTIPTLLLGEASALSSACSNQHSVNVFAFYCQNILLKPICWFGPNSNVLCLYTLQCYCACSAPLCKKKSMMASAAKMMLLPCVQLLNKALENAYMMLWEVDMFHFHDKHQHCTAVDKMDVC
jgi:hypothetical protein